MMDWNLDDQLNDDIVAFSGSFSELDDAVQDDEEEYSSTDPSHTASSSGSYARFLSSVSNEPLAPPFDFGFGESPHSPAPSAPGCASHMTSPSRSSPLQPSRPLQPPPYPYPKNTLNSQCVRACTQIISGLENYLLADLKVLDLVLEVVKRAADKLEQLISLQQESRCSRCMTLFTTIMHQIIELFEAGCTAFLTEQGGGQGGDGGASACFEKVNPLLSGNAFSGDLGFRAFAIDPEDQFQWKSRMVLKELQQATKVLQKLNALMKSGEHNSNSSVNNCGCCFDGLMGRFKSLYERVSGGKR